MLKIKVTGILKSLERWASESEERSRLVIILIWVGFGLFVIGAILIAAWIMLPASPPVKPV